jgi:hypothetical protein
MSTQEWQAVVYTLACAYGHELVQWQSPSPADRCWYCGHEGRRVCARGEGEGGAFAGREPEFEPAS